MNDNREANWCKYKSDFLRANRCTDREFEADYIAFMQGKPNAKAYRMFARKYGITVHRDPYIHQDAQVVLSVNISAIKVMAKTFQESEAAIEEILTSR